MSTRSCQTAWAQFGLDLGNASEVIDSDSVVRAGKGFVFESRDLATLEGFDEPERVQSVTNG